MSKPILSICIPTYNRADKVLKCILSSLEVVSNEIEVFVCDNGSEDDTWNVLNSIIDNRLRIIRNSVNCGFALNLLRVVEESKSNFVFLMSDDDLVNPKFIDSIIEERLLESSNLGLIYGSIYSIGDKNYYSKYNDTVCRGSLAYKRCAIKHPYMSSMLFSKSEIDFERLRSYIKNEKHFMYPQEVMVLMILNRQKEAILRSDIACYQGEPGKSFIEDETEYFNYSQRIELVAQYIRISDDISLNRNLSRILYKNLADIVVQVLFDKIAWGNLKSFKLKLKKIGFYISVLKIKGVGLYLGVRFLLRVLRTSSFVKIIMKIKSLIKSS
ncbi:MULTISPECIES: glycosyltransferase family 2 protein [unclassified Oceanispirochaeta]|uniref:glycosyltransferase family 2 protein n=1 Tax=unclassified Oceanispirochaeta TaxID=2635722 RepID=UPI000E090502|nr:MULTISPECIES: glycosyltransferase family 2 protein [unclassified Oceanispirochaeta]MBF9017745.1 glycosyltransferase family 2 protein [Oceanispirochaeta sp. M2]NPD75540.1 glycosyltransferase family 2 protein [Oceanispirochaeta sp. M1]RDG28602.1 glycosyltransferase family 2 protein [Oceanispirochaeta sp. M1]